MRASCQGEAKACFRINGKFQVGKSENSVTHEILDVEPSTITDNFRAYSGIAEAVDDHG
jgi:flagellum-specific peptidoglycan hydrolase FlgJ